MAYKVLVVDDEFAMRRALEEKLKSDGFEVVTAGDGTEALAAINKEKFDMIVTDLIMPGMNGFDLLKTLKENGIKIPTIVTSNLGSVEDKEKVLGLGAIELYDKTQIPIYEIPARIKEYLEGGKKKSEEVKPEEKDTSTPEDSDEAEEMPKAA